MPASSSSMANFTPTTDDYSVTQLLANTFGDVTGNMFGVAATSQLANVMGTAFAYFNSAVLFFGTVILAYVTVFGIMNTANDGQVLGKRWSTGTTPARISVSAMSLIPTSSGYSIIQLVVMQIVVWGVGIADTTWTNIVSASLTKSMPNTFTAMSRDTTAVKKLAGDLLLSKVCAWQLNDILGAVTEGPAKTNIAAVTENSAFARSAWTYDKTVFHFKDIATPPTSNGADICGSVTFEYRSGFNAANPIFTWGTNPGAQALQGNAINSAAFTQQIASAVVMNANQAAFAVLDSNIGLLADKINNGTYVPADADLFRQAVTGYLNTAKTNFDTAFNAQLASLNGGSPVINQFLNETTSKGWVFAGMWHRRLSQIQEAMNDARKVYPTSEPPNFDMIRATAPQLDQGFLTAYAQAQRLAQAAIADGGATASAQPDTTAMGDSVGLPSLDINPGVTDVKTVWNNWTTGMGQSIIAGLVNFTMGSDASTGWHDPVLQVKSMGDWMMTGAEAMIAAKTFAVIAIEVGKATSETVFSNAAGRAVNFVTGANDGIKAWLDMAAKTVNELWSLIGPSAWAMLYTGYFMAIYLPMVPYMIFTLAVVGWLIAVVESVVAAPLWMVMHMTPEGSDSFIGSQQQGYMLLLSVFFRPVLTVVGLLASLILLRPVMDFVNTGFIGSMSVMQSGTWTGIGSIMGYMLVYAFITAAIFFMVFGLPQDLSDRVLKWIGAGIGSLGEREGANRVESGASGMGRTAVQSAQRREQMMQDRISKAIEHRKQASAKGGAVGGGTPVTRIS